MNMLIPSRYAIILPLLIGGSASAQGPTLQRVGEIGCSDCGGAAQFATILDLSLTDSGTVLVVSSEEPTLRMFDRSGRVLWSSGRTGAGPGEYRLPIRAVVGPRSIQVVDLTLRRVTRIDRAGTFVSHAPLGGFAASVGPRGRTGEMVILVDNFRGDFSLQRWSVTDSGTAIGTVPKSDAARAGTLTIPSMAVAPNGQIAVLRDPNEYRILRLSPAGETLGEITRDVERVKRTEAEIQALERRRQAAQKRATERTQGGGSAPVLPVRPPAADLKPHISVDGLRFDDTGRLWAKTMRGNERSTVFDLFAADGRYIGEVTVPAAVGAFSQAGRWMVTDVESDDGTPRVVLWEVRG
jgi:hypothetical protein